MNYTYIKNKFEKLCVDENMDYAIGYILDIVKDLDKENREIKADIENVLIVKATQTKEEFNRFCASLEKKYMW